MKASLVKLLFEEYKQARLFDELEAKGIDLLDVAVHNLDIVCDLIGFPEHTCRNKVSYNPDTKQIETIINEDGYDREFIYLEFDQIFDTIKKKQNIEVTDTGLKMTEQEDDVLAIKKITEFVDWLYIERKRCLPNS